MTNKAVYCNSYYGPSMGNLFCCNNNWNYSDGDNGNRYPRIGIPKVFQMFVEELIYQKFNWGIVNDLLAESLISSLKSKS
ncbi:unnamed protein product [Rhizophagus irregularis]|nr:unnamed protein product [Rhizophagus irregularis]